jgi:hypothetical protein
MDAIDPSCPHQALVLAWLLLNSPTITFIPDNLNLLEKGSQLQGQ